LDTRKSNIFNSRKHRKKEGRRCKTNSDYSESEEIILESGKWTLDST
jgi:hypothetical protein